MPRTVKKTSRLVVPKSDGPKPTVKRPLHKTYPIPIVVANARRKNPPVDTGHKHFGGKAVYKSHRGSYFYYTQNHKKVYIKHDKVELYGYDKIRRHVHIPSRPAAKWHGHAVRNPDYVEPGPAAHLDDETEIPLDRKRHKSKKSTSML